MPLPTAHPGLPGNASHHPPRHATAEEFDAPDGMCGGVFQTGRYRQARGHFTRRRQRDEVAGLAGKTEGVLADVSSQAPRSASAELRPGCDEGAIGLHCASPWTDQNIAAVAPPLPPRAAWARRLSRHFHGCAVPGHSLSVPPPASPRTQSDPAPGAGSQIRSILSRTDVRDQPWRCPPYGVRLQSAWPWPS